MSPSKSDLMTATVPAPLRPATLRAGLTLAVIAALAAFAVREQAQQNGAKLGDAKSRSAKAAQSYLVSRNALVNSQARNHLNSSVGLTFSF